MTRSLCWQLDRMANAYADVANSTRMLALLAASLGVAPRFPPPLPRARLHAVAQQRAALGEVRKTIHEVAALAASSYEHTTALEQPGVLTVSVHWKSADEPEEALAAARNAGCRVSFLRGEHLERKLLIEAEAAAKRAVEAEAEA